MAVFLLTPAMVAGAEQKEEQFWPELDVYYRFNPDTRLFFMLAPTREIENGQVSDIDELQFKTGPHLAVVPFGSVEFYWDSRSDDWVRTLYKVGTTVAVKPWFAPQLYWGHEINEGSSGDSIIDALGITLKFYF